MSELLVKLQNHTYNLYWWNLHSKMFILFFYSRQSEWNDADTYTVLQPLLPAYKAILYSTTERRFLSLLLSRTQQNAYVSESMANYLYKTARLLYAFVYGLYDAVEANGRRDAMAMHILLTMGSLYAERAVTFASLSEISQPAPFHAFSRTQWWTPAAARIFNFLSASGIASSLFLPLSE